MAERTPPRFFLALLIGATLLLALVLRPLASELVVAAVLAGMLWPLQQWLTHHLHGHRNIAAGLLTLAVVVLLLGPIAALATYVIRDGADGVRFVSQALHSEHVSALVAHLPRDARDAVIDAIDHLPRDASEAVGTVGGEHAASSIGEVLVATGSIVFHTALMLIMLFFLLVRGRDLVVWLDSVSPLRPGHTLELLSTFRRVSFAVIASAAISAAVQAAAALFGYTIAGVPSPLFFALVTFFFALVPAIGASVVCLFAAGLLLVTGHLGMAIFLAAWGLIVVGLVDNLIKPLLIRKGLEIHGGVIFFSLLGGLAAFGTIGLILGPLIVAFFLAVVRIYHRDYTPGDDRLPRVPGMPPDEAPR